MSEIIKNTSLAWQLGLLKDSSYGFGATYDHYGPKVTGASRVTEPLYKRQGRFGLMGHSVGGPLMSGLDWKDSKGEYHQDYHLQGMTTEGEQISAGKLQCGALFAFPEYLQLGWKFPSLETFRTEVPTPGYSSVGADGTPIVMAEGSKGGPFLFNNVFVPVRTRNVVRGSSSTYLFTNVQSYSEDGSVENEINLEETPDVTDVLYPLSDGIFNEVFCVFDNHFPYGHPSYGPGRGVWHWITDAPFYRNVTITAAADWGPPRGDESASASGNGTASAAGGMGGIISTDDIASEIPAPPEISLMDPKVRGAGAQRAVETLKTYMTTSLQSIVAQGIPLRSGEPSFTNANDLHSMADLKAYSSLVPASGVFSAFYKYEENWKYPTYTAGQQPRNRGGSGTYAQGTAPGGFLFHQPEIPLQEFRGFQEDAVALPYATRTYSQVGFGLAPEAHFYFGTPAFKGTDVVHKGYYKKYNFTTGFLDHRYVDGASSDVLLERDPVSTSGNKEFYSHLYVTQDLYWLSGTSFYGVQVHNNSANRTYTWPDKSFTVAGTDDVAAIDFWDRTSTDIHPQNAGDTISFTDSSTVPTGRGVSDTDSGWSVASNVFYGWTGGAEAFRADSSGNFQARGDVWFKSGTSFLAKFEHNNSADRAYTLPDDPGTIALATGLSGDQTIYGSTGGTGSIFLKGNSVDNLGLEVNQIGHAYLDRDYLWYSATSFIGQLSHNNSANRSYAYPDRTGNVTVVDVQEFSANGNWTIPDGATYVLVEIFGAGGGGGGGYGAAVSNLRCGGGGGGGGGYASRLYKASDLSGTGTIVSGLGGTAGTAAGNGGNGAVSSFTITGGITLQAGGGGGGRAGAAGAGGVGWGGGGIFGNSTSATGGSPGGSAADTDNPHAGGAGGATVGKAGSNATYGGGGGAGGDSAGSVGTDGGSSIYGCGGGGSGGGINAANPGTNRAGGEGGKSGAYSAGGGGTAGASNGGTGGTGSFMCGGGGGGSKNNGTGGAGGPGGYGGGGGGGGGGTATGGAGGAGGRGFIRITSW